MIFDVFGRTKSIERLKSQTSLQGLEKRVFGKSSEMILQNLEYILGFQSLLDLGQK